MLSTHAGFEIQSTLAIIGMHDYFNLHKNNPLRGNNERS